MTETLEQHYHNHPCIVAMWHGQFMLLPLIKPPFIPVDVMLARHRDAEMLGEDAATLRHAADPWRRRRLAWQGPRRCACLHGGRAGAARGRTVAMTADVPGGEARRPGRASSWSRGNRAGPILPVAIATSRYLAFNTWSRMTVNLPFSGLGFAVGPMVRVPREADPERARDLSAGRRGHRSTRRRPLPSRAPAPTRRAPRRAAALASRTKPGISIKAYRVADQPGPPGNPAAVGPARTQRQGGPSAASGTARPPERCAATGPPCLVSCGQRRRNHGGAAADFGVGGGAPEPVVSAHDRHRDVGRTRRQRVGPRTIHQYAPLDVPRYVRGFLEHWKPDLAVFTESEIWPNLIIESAARDIPLALINARMTKRSFRRWRRVPGLAQPAVQSLRAGAGAKRKPRQPLQRARAPRNACRSAI